MSWLTVGYREFRKVVRERVWPKATSKLLKTWYDPLAAAAPRAARVCVCLSWLIGCVCVPLGAASVRVCLSWRLSRRVCRSWPLCVCASHGASRSAVRVCLDRSPVASPLSDPSPPHHPPRPSLAARPFHSHDPPAHRLP